MPHSLLFFIKINAVAKGLFLHGMVKAQKAHQFLARGFKIGSHAVYFHPVAGGKHQGFRDNGNVPQMKKDGRQIIFWESEIFPEFDRREFMIKSDDKKSKKH